ncbi:MAG TPA: DUF4386 family protein [Anaerolineales bacterium]|nr:DUF4386 family protein [Anaerolineales bacterium]
MNDLKRIGGWSAILFGIAVVVAFGLFIPTFSAMPADAMQIENSAGRLAVVGGMTSAQRAGLALGFAFETLAGILMFPALLALHAEAKNESEARSTLALGMAALGIPFFMLSHFSGFSLVQMSNGFGSAGEVVQAARAAAYGYAERLSTVYEPVFWLFFAWSAVLWLGLMSSGLFPRWLAWVGLAAALLGVIGTVGGVVVPVLEFLSPMALLVLVVWFIGLGVWLLRSGRGAG